MGGGFYRNAGRQEGRINFLGRATGGVIRPEDVWLRVLSGTARQKLAGAGRANRALRHLIGKGVRRGGCAPVDKLRRVEIIGVESNGQEN
jgi:hypothetical protein